MMLHSHFPRKLYKLVSNLATSMAAYAVGSQQVYAEMAVLGFIVLIYFLIDWNIDIFPFFLPIKSYLLSWECLKLLSVSISKDMTLDTEVFVGASSHMFGKWGNDNYIGKLVHFLYLLRLPPVMLRNLLQ